MSIEIYLNSLTQFFLFLDKCIFIFLNLNANTWKILKF